MSNKTANKPRESGPYKTGKGAQGEPVHPQGPRELGKKHSEVLKRKEAGAHKA